MLREEEHRGFTFRMHAATLLSMPSSSSRRVLAAVLFTDIVNSTSVAEELGDRTWKVLIERHHRIVRRELKRFRGREIDTAGDGFFATFSEPASAIACACAIADAVRELGIEIRAGVHFGECERMDKKIGGITVVVGARTVALGGAGEVLVSGTVAELTRGAGFAIRDHGTHVLKGVDGEWRILAVTSVDGEPREGPLDPDEAARRRSSFAAEVAGLRLRALLATRTRRRILAMGVAAAVVAAAIILFPALVNTDDDLPSIMSVSFGNREDDQVFELSDQGFARAEQEFGIIVNNASALLPAETIVAQAVASKVDLVILDATALSQMPSLNLLVPPTHFVLGIQGPDFALEEANLTGLVVSFQQSGFLAGVAAASTTKSGVIGYVGATRGSRSTDYAFDRFRAGYEAGARWVDADVRIVAALVSKFAPKVDPFVAPQVAKRLARLEFGMGADVVFHAAGVSGFGVFEAATEESTPDRHLWAIGVDTDQWQTASQEQRDHILTSTIIRWDLVNYDVIRDFLSGTLEPGERKLTVAGGLISYSTSGDSLTSEAIVNLDRAIDELSAGELEAPISPTGALLTDPV